MDKVLDEIIEIKVDKDILDFLKVPYFGTFSNPFKVASSKVYYDKNRTIRFNGLSNKIGLELREKFQN